MLNVTKNQIYLTRGDSASLKLELKDVSGNAYTPRTGDSIHFRLKKDVNGDLLLDKTANISTMTVELDPTDTDDLEFSMYRYEVELITSGGKHYTVIENMPFSVGVELG